MSINLSGKYWRLQDLEKEFSRPASNLYPILNSLTGVVRVGAIFLIPDAIMPVLRQRIAHNDSYTIGTAAIMLKISEGLVKRFIAQGLPVCKSENNQPRIWKAHIPALQNAIAEIRRRHGGFNKEHVAEALEIAMREIESAGDDLPY